MTEKNEKIVLNTNICTIRFKMDEYKINKKQSWKNNNNIFNHSDTEATTHNLEGKKCETNIFKLQNKRRIIIISVDKEKLSHHFQSQECETYHLSHALLTAKNE